MREKIRNIISYILGYGFWAGVFFCVYYFKKDSNHRDVRQYNFEAITEDSNENDEEATNSCGFNDGLHSATIDYYNPATGHSATYSLDVEVENCEVTTIYFNNGGWLDVSHINPSELDESGDAELEDDRGRTFSVHLDD